MGSGAKRVTPMTWKDWLFIVLIVLGVAIFSALQSPQISGPVVDDGTGEVTEVPATPDQPPPQ